MTKRAVEIGTAGEHVVCADLLMAGHRASMAAAGLPYDVIADIDARLYRVTVKSTVAPCVRPDRRNNPPRYRFSICRRARRPSGRLTITPYETSTVDLVAMVALDIRRVAYLPLAICPQCQWIEAGEFDRFTLASALERFAQ